MDEPRKMLVGRELASVEFVRHYWMLHFDGPYLTIVSSPTVISKGQVTKEGDPGFERSLVELVDKRVAGLGVDIEGDYMHLDFEGGAQLRIPLVSGCDSASESVLLNESVNGGRWWVWPEWGP